jgi:hypothetical protein
MTGGISVQEAQLSDAEISGEMSIKGGEGSIKGGEVWIKGQELSIKGQELSSKGQELSIKGQKVSIKGGEMSTKGHDGPREVPRLSSSLPRVKSNGEIGGVLLPTERRNGT